MLQMQAEQCFLISQEINVADAHPSGKRPFGREQYINKFITLTKGLISNNASDRFLKTVQNLKNLKSKDLDGLNIEMIHPLKYRFNKKKSIF